MDRCKFDKNKTGWGDSEWISARAEILGFALHLSGLSLDELRDITLSVPAQVLLTGLLIMADWIASNESYFPYKEEFIDYGNKLRNRVDGAWELLGSLSKWEPDIGSSELVINRFKLAPRPFQKDVESIARAHHPELMIIEAPMGEGKTEAALVAAEVLASEHGKTGLMFALPTQATSDGMFPRIREWVKKAVHPEEGEEYSILLAHGKSRFNREYKSIRRGNWNVNSEDTVIIKEWFTGRKKGLLSDFVIGTVDQVLMVGLKQKHLAMRHLGLSNKIVVIDECHAYDVYMGSYLETALSWLGAYEVPVILLSATLPPRRKLELVEAYRGTNRVSYRDVSLPEWAEDIRYPLITYLEEDTIRNSAPKASGRSMDVKISAITDGKIVEVAEDAAADGGFIAIIVNTVKRAQHIASLLAERSGWGCVWLLHSRLIALDRVERESDVMNMLNTGSRTEFANRLFVVGTQVMEQSLDLDFDAMITDLCPVDLLLQRMGRLHRHSERRRSKANENPKCFVVDGPEKEFPEGSKEVYGELQLLNTRMLLRGRSTIRIPGDIPCMVHEAYGGHIKVPKDIENEYRKAEKEAEVVRSRKEMKAEAFQIRIPKNVSGHCLTGWLNTDVADNEIKAEASVRDANGALDVIVIRRLRDGSLHMLPWIMGGREIPQDKIPSDIAFVISECKVSLPGTFVNPGSIDDSIGRLEKSNTQMLNIRRWYESEWLNGELFLILDENMESRQLSKTVRYDRNLGLQVVN